MLSNKKILLGVCGSIASYKSATLVRLLVKAGAEVRVVMTPDAGHFITALTLSTLSKNPVHQSYFDPQTGTWDNHVELGLWPDLFIIAPITANTIAKLANGICDNLLTAVYLSARCPVYFAPAMDLDMWKHPATQRNVARLKSNNNLLIKPTVGELASGLTGEGRMAEPEEIIEYLEEEIKKKELFAGKNVLITAGPTYEAIDPVRYIGNHSSGKMGFALAEEIANMGGRVILISGPVSLSLSNPAITRIDVVSAQDMLNAVLNSIAEQDIAIFSAAVADYRPQEVASQKIKKNDSAIELKLEKTPDILATVGLNKSPGQIVVGFALETENEVENAIRKLQIKNLDIIVLNSTRDKGATFKSDSNKITLIGKDLVPHTYELKPKTEVARDIAQKILALM